MFLFMFLCDLLFAGRSEKNHQNIVVITEGQNVDISFVLMMFYEMRVFSQMRFLKDFCETMKGKKRTWANPMGSKQLKSLYEIDNLIFCSYMCFFVF